LPIRSREVKLDPFGVEGATADHATLTVCYGATSKDGSGAQFASPMVVSVARGPYKKVIFIENGKEVGKASFREGNDRQRQGENERATH